MATKRADTDDLIGSLDKLVGEAVARYPQPEYVERLGILQAHAATVRMNLEQLAEAHVNALAHREYVKAEASRAALEAAGLPADDDTVSDDGQEA